MKGESGQALLSGLVFIMIVLFFCVYFIHYSESLKRLYTNSQTSKNELIQKLSQSANILNEISLNNRIILSQIISAQRSFVKAAQMGIYQSYHQPYWDTYAQKTGSSSFSASASSPLSRASVQSLQDIYTAHSLSTGRNYVIAAALSSRNALLVQKLPPALKAFLVELSHESVQCACLAYLEQERYLKDQISIPLLSSLYQFDFNAQNCTLQHHIPALYQVVNKELPFFSTTAKDEVVSFRALTHMPSFSLFRAGIFIVSPSFQKGFLESLKEKTSTSVSALNRDTVFTRFLVAIRFLPSFAAQGFGAVVLPYEGRIVHPLLEEKGELFVRSFFDPRWTAVISAQGDFYVTQK